MVTSTAPVTARYSLGNDIPNTEIPHGYMKTHVNQVISQGFPQTRKYHVANNVDAIQNSTAGPCISMIPQMAQST